MNMPSEQEIELAKSADSEKVWTYADYCALEDDQRYEIIDGKLVPLYMGLPSPGMKHVVLSSNLHGHIWTHLRGRNYKVFAAPCDVIFVENEEDGQQSKTVMQPDLFVLCDLSKLREEGCYGAPEIVIEILSPSTWRKDMQIKRAVYEKFGVLEYLIVDPMYRQVLAFRLKQGLYGEAAVYDENDLFVSSVLPELSLDLAAIFAVLPVQDS